MRDSITELGGQGTTLSNINNLRSWRTRVVESTSVDSSDISFLHKIAVKKPFPQVKINYELIRTINRIGLLPIDLRNTINLKNSGQYIDSFLRYQILDIASTSDLNDRSIKVKQFEKDIKTLKNKFGFDFNTALYTKKNSNYSPIAKDTLLSLTIKIDAYDLAEILIDHGGAKNIPDKFNNLSPLHWMLIKAIEDESLVNSSLMNKLVNQATNLNAWSQTRFDFKNWHIHRKYKIDISGTPSMVAYWHGHDELVAELKVLGSPLTTKHVLGMANWFKNNLRVDYRILKEEFELNRELTTKEKQKYNDKLKGLDEFYAAKIQRLTQLCLNIARIEQDDGYILSCFFEKSKILDFIRQFASKSLYQKLCNLYDIQPLNELPDYNSCSIPTPENAISDENIDWTPQDGKFQLIGAGIKEIPNDFCSFTDLQNLNLSNNQLTKLPENFSNLQKLSILFLENNQLTSLPGDFNNLQKLTALALGNNQLASISDDFNNLQALQALGLYSNQLTKLPDNFGNLQKLQALGLFNNQLTKLPESLGNLKKLTHLTLQNNQLTKLPDSFGDLQRLQDLALFNNQLTKLPDNFGNLQRLQSLALFNNQLTKLPDNFGNLQNLYFLNLYNNQLVSLPVDFGNLHKLSSLILRNNQLTELPKNFGNLKKLIRLALQSNQLTKLPDNFSNLQRLIILTLQNNQLKKLPDNFGNLRSLKKLNLRNNQLTKLPDGFSNLQELRELSLENNQLTLLPESFGNLKGLKKLRLGKNKLESIPDSIGNLAQLEVLDLSNNQLKSIPSSIANLTKLKMLDLRGNKINTSSSEFQAIRKKLGKNGTIVYI